MHLKSIPRGLQQGRVHDTQTILSSGLPSLPLGKLSEYFISKFAPLQFKPIFVLCLVLIKQTIFFLSAYLEAIALSLLFSRPNKPNQPNLSTSSCPMEGPGTPLASLGWPLSEGIVTVRVAMIMFILTYRFEPKPDTNLLFCSFWGHICYKLKLFHIEILVEQAYHIFFILLQQNPCGLKDHSDKENRGS